MRIPSNDIFLGGDEMSIRFISSVTQMEQYMFTDWWNAIMICGACNER
jgi:hypothetical protein